MVLPASAPDRAAFTAVDHSKARRVFRGLTCHSGTGLARVEAFMSRAVAWAPTSGRTIYVGNARKRGIVVVFSLHAASLDPRVGAFRRLMPAGRAHGAQTAFGIGIVSARALDLAADLVLISAAAGKAMFGR